MRRRAPLRRGAPRDQSGEPGRAAFKAFSHGCCGVCGAAGVRLRHHVVSERDVRRVPGGDPWDPANALWVGVYCRCHADHHARRRPIPLTVLPEAAVAFASDLLGERAAADYLRRHYG